MEGQNFFTSAQGAQSYGDNATLLPTHRARAPKIGVWRDAGAKRSPRLALILKNVHREEKNTLYMHIR